MKRLSLLAVACLIPSTHTFGMFKKQQEEWAAKDHAYYFFRAGVPTFVSAGAALGSFVAARYVNNPIATVGIALGGNAAGAAASHDLKNWMNDNEKKMEAQLGKKLPYSVNDLGYTHLAISGLGFVAVSADMARAMMAQQEELKKANTNLTLIGNDLASSRQTNDKINAELSAAKESLQLSKKDAVTQTALLNEQIKELKENIATKAKKKAIKWLKATGAIKSNDSATENKPE